MEDSMPMLDLNRLRPVFEKIRDSVVDDVPGVVCIDSGKPGPAVGVTVCTHGNEPAGLAAARYLMSENFSLKQGKLYIVCNNIAAAQQFFDAPNDEARQATRSSGGHQGQNMNRLPEDIMTRVLSDADPYEYHRVQQLAPIWRKFTDGGLDIHTTSADAPSMFIPPDNLDEDIKEKMGDVLPVDAVLHKIDKYLGAKLTVHFYGDTSSGKTKGAPIEAGQHMLQRSGDCAIASTLSWLHALDMVEQAPHSHKLASEEQKEYYEVTSEFRLPSPKEDEEDYFLALPLGAFVWVNEGQLIARTRSGKQVFAPQAGYVVMCPVYKDPLNTPLRKVDALMYFTRKLERSCEKAPAMLAL